MRRPPGTDYSLRLHTVASEPGGGGVAAPEINEGDVAP